MTTHIPEALRLQIDEHGTSIEGCALTPNGGRTQPAQKGSYCIEGPRKNKDAHGLVVKGEAN